MKLECTKCGKTLEFSGDRPSFCAYCGHSLGGDRDLAATTPAVTRPEAATAAYGRDEAAAAPPPERVGGYRLLRQLGRGGMGAVYEAEEPATGRRVAVKLLAPHAADAPGALERFRQEGRLASLIAHPRCVFVLQADEEAGRPYIVMELMPGDTLEDPVRRDGPRPVAEAVAQILDVIEGLQEAHRQGVLHRDVKPSNCFLQPDGRVKVGDFGLSKALASDVRLTRTGAFLGTVLFAAPEQIKGEPLSFATDVYAVAATLYYLLTGRAPFDGTDAAAILARIVSEDPAPVRAYRPDVPTALDRVILRGLERPRDRRFADLEGLRQALMPFLPGQLAPAERGPRVRAFLVDLVLLSPVFWLPVLLNLAAGGDGEPFLIASGLTDLLMFLYFAGLDGLWGGTPGKRMLRLRVRAAGGYGPPPFWRALLRTLVFYVPVLVLPGQVTADDETGLGFLALTAAAVAVLGLPMRRANGYRGLHDLASGTRVVQLAWPKPQPTYPVPEPAPPAPVPAGLPAQIGPFALRGLLTDAGPAGRVLVGEDPTLGRRVWLWLRPAAGDDPPPPQVTRATRLRWLAQGRLAGAAWDAFVAPAGAPLAEVLAAAPERRLNWTAARPLLEQLTDELAAAVADGTLPAALSVDHLWLQPGGRPVLLTVPPPGGGAAPVLAGGDPRRRALGVLRQAASAALEGAPRAEGAAEPVRAPLPRYAQTLLGRLFGDRPGYADVATWRADLAAVRDRPTEVTTALRGPHLWVLGMLLALPLATLFFVSSRFYATVVHPLWGLHQNLNRAERVLAMLDDPAERGRLRQAVNPDHEGVIDDPSFRRRVERQLAEDEAELRRRVAETGPVGRWLGDFLYPYRDPRAMGHERLRVPMGLSPDERRAEFRLVYYRLHGRLSQEDEAATFALATIGTWTAAWIVWAVLTRGGMSYRVLGIALVRSNGRRARRLQCLLRAALTWLPLAALLIGAVWAGQEPGLVGLHWLLWLVAVAYVAGAVALVLRYPARSVHDRLTGVYLVPW